MQDYGQCLTWWVKDQANREGWEGLFLPGLHVMYLHFIIIKLLTGLSISANGYCQYHAFLKVLNSTCGCIFHSKVFDLSSWFYSYTFLKFFIQKLVITWQHVYSKVPESWKSIPSTCIAKATRTHRRPSKQVVSTVSSRLLQISNEPQGFWTVKSKCTALLNWKWKFGGIRVASACALWPNYLLSCAWVFRIAYGSLELIWKRV